MVTLADSYLPFYRRVQPDNRTVLPDVPVISRKDFIKLFAENYQPGQHVTFLGPSGRGKTQLMGEVLGSVLRRFKGNLTARVLHGKIKGRDLTIEKLSASARLPFTRTFPPSRFRKMRYRKSRGWIIRPLERAGETPEAENKLITGEFRRGIHKSYQASIKKPVILVVDEAHQAHNDLGLRKDCEGPLMRGRPACGVWSLVQRGRYVSYMVYDQAEWLLIFFDPDRDNQQRYSEIGGVDKQVLVELSRKLKTRTVADGSTISQALCFRRSGDQLFIVDT